MKGAKKAAEGLNEFLYTNYGEMDTTVGVGKDSLIVYVFRGKKCMSSIPKDWKGFTVQKRWIGKVAPA